MLAVSFGFLTQLKTIFWCNPCIGKVETASFWPIPWWTCGTPATENTLVLIGKKENRRNHKKKQGFHRKGQGDQRRTSDDLRQRMQNRGIGIGSSPIGNEGFAHPSARPRRSKMYYTNFVGYIHYIYCILYYTLFSIKYNIIYYITYYIINYIKYYIIYYIINHIVYIYIYIVLYIILYIILNIKFYIKLYIL